MIKNKYLEKPIFIVGHARGGSTLLGAIINAHSEVGPKFLKAGTLNTNYYKNYRNHFNFSEKLEQKEIWFKYFKGKDCFTHIGKEIFEESLTLSNEERKKLISELTLNFKENRFLSKTPTNSFRINAIKDLFPDAKIVVILRKGEEVVASWGQRSYGFGKEVYWGNLHIKKLTYRKGIDIFSRKWEEVIDAIKISNEKHDLFMISYDDLILNTQKTLKKIFNYLELPFESYLENIVLFKDKSKWKSNIPFYYQYYLRLKVKRGLGKMKEMGIHFN